MRHFYKPLYVSYWITNEAECLKQSMTPEADAVCNAFDLVSDKIPSIVIIRYALQHRRDALNETTVPSRQQVQ